MVGRSLLEVVVLSGYHDLVARMAERHHFWAAESVRPRKSWCAMPSGLDTPVEMDLIRVGVADQLLVMVQLRDITDRKRLERQLETYREELEDQSPGAHAGN